MNKALAFPLLAVIVLFGCSGAKEESFVSANAKAGWITFSEFQNVEFSYPSEAQYRKKHNERSVTMTTSTLAFPKDPQHFFLELKSVSESCSSLLIEPMMLTNTTTTYSVWGKPPPFPCSVDYCDDTQFGYNDYKGRYVFCSEHNGRTVVIEVNEITDNPTLALDIFKTFHWTK